MYMVGGGAVVCIRGDFLVGRRGNGVCSGSGRVLILSMAVVV